VIWRVPFRSCAPLTAPLLQKTQCVESEAYSAEMATSKAHLSVFTKR